MGILIYVSVGTIFKMNRFNIFVTDKRLLFSHITKDANKETERLLSEKVKGKSFTERLSIISSHHYVVPERYETMSYEEILNEHPMNFELNLDDIVSVKIKRPKTTDTKGWQNPDYMIIQTNAKKYRVNSISKDDQVTLNKVLGDRAKVPRIIL